MSTSRTLVPLGANTQISTAFAYDPGPRWEENLGRRNGLLDAFYRHRLKILGAVVLGAIAGWLLAYLTPPTYRAEGKVEFEQAPANTAQKQFAETQQDLILSRSLAQKVATSLNLKRNRRIAAALGVRNPASASDDDVVDRLRNSVAVYFSGDSRLAGISFDSRDPDVSANIANSYLDNYVESDFQRQYDRNVELRRMLDERLADAKSRLDSSEKALIDYTRAAGLIDPSAGTSSVTGGSAPHSLASDNLAQLNQSYSQARADRIAAEQRWQEAQRTPLLSLPEVLSNPTVQQLTQKSAEAQAALQEQRQHRLDTHPLVVAAAAQVDEINRQIESVATSIRDSIRDRYDVAQRQEADLAGTVERLQAQTLADQGKGAKYNVLKRDADSNRQTFEALLQRSNELSSTAGMNPNDLSVVDHAVPPKSPISPRPVLWSGLGALIAFLFPFGFALVSAFRDDRVRSPESVDTDLRLRVLGVLPRVKNPAEALADPASTLSEAHYSLRASLELSSPRATSRCILFTSSREGEGKSTAAYGVARDFAYSGKRTLLMDGDMRKPSIDDFFDLDSPLGLSTVLADLCTPEAATLHTAIPGLSVMFAGPMPPSAAALLSGTHFKALLKHLAGRFEVIIIDAPPVYGLADSPRMAASAKETVFVVETDRAKFPEVRAALRRLVEARASVAGAILTKFDLTKSRSNLYVYSYPGQRRRARLEVA
jgi:polysaccharide biosynthesis transport protein